MNLFCTSFGPVYTVFAEVLRRSVADNSPETVWAYEEMAPARPVPGIVGHASINTSKLEVWNRHAQCIHADTIYCDADMLCLGELGDAFAGDFDFAYTVRPGLKRIQAGVVFVRATDAGRRMMQEWALLNDSLLDDPDRLDELIHVHGGCNQAALSLLLENPPDGVSVAELPCEVWNSCHQTWGTFGPDTRLLHLTGRLRRAAMEGRVPSKRGPYADVIPMVAAWMEYR